MYCGLTNEAVARPRNLGTSVPRLARGLAEGKKL